MPQTDRRRQPRVRVDLPLHLTFRDQTVETLIRDLSSSGIRFRTPTELPLMTRVQIAIELPEASGPGGTAGLAITGVVVRCDSTSEGDAANPYDTAIYFEDLSERSRALLDKFVRARLG